MNVYGITISAEELATFSARDVASLAAEDVHAVLREGHRRQDEAQKALDKAERQLAKAQAAVNAAKLYRDAAGDIIRAAHAEQRNQADAWFAKRRDAETLLNAACHGAGADARWAARDALDAMALAKGYVDASGPTLAGNAYLLLQSLNFPDATLDAYRQACPISR